MNNEAVAYIHSPVLISAAEDLNQVPRLGFLVVLGLKMQTERCLMLQPTVFPQHLTRGGMWGKQAQDFNSERAKHVQTVNNERPSMP